jgi:hypothetical protein
MPVTYTFTTPDGAESRPVPADLTDEQYGFLRLSEMGIGIPKLDRSTLDEFVRRADLLQAYVGTVLRTPEGEPRILTRADFVKLLPGARTNWTARSKREFDQLMKKEIADYWAAVDAKKN